MTLFSILSLLVVLSIVTNVVQGCQDKYTFCFAYKMMGYCTSDKYYMRANCPKSCHLCPTGKTTQSPPATLPTVDPSTCGRRGDGHTRIVGGSNARPGDWPWQVQIDLIGDWNKYWCGGTLLNDEWILSAAHCFEDDLDPSSYSIKLGEHDIRKKSPVEQKHAIDKIIMHPGYDADSANNDMALLRLKKKASINKFVRPACFPDASVNFSPGEECYITGWGALKTGGSSPRILQQAKIPLVSQTECIRAMGKSDITRSMFCAGYDNKKIDSCQGDSGGPLVCKKRNTATGEDVWYHWGVVSWGIDCASPGYYGVYSSVHTMGQWVSNIVFKSK